MSIDSRSIRNRTAVVGVGYTPVVRHPDRSPDAFAQEAALAAISDAGLKTEDIDGYAGCPMGTAGDMSAGSMVRALGLKEPRWVFDVQGGPTLGLATAIHALYAGYCHNALVLLSASSAGQARRGGGTERQMAPGPAQYALPYGLGGGGGQFALDLQRYTHDFGATREQLFAVVKAARCHAQLNPWPYWRGKDLTLDDYLSSRVRDPAGRRRDEASFCTDVSVGAAFILEAYARRWTLEVAFRDGKQLGFEDPQNQTAQAVRRTAPWPSSSTTWSCCGRPTRPGPARSRAGCSAPGTETRPRLPSGTC